MKITTFKVDGEPTGQSRPRLGRYGSVYSKKSPWRIHVQELAAKYGMLEGALEIFINYYIERPKSHYRTGRNSHILKDSSPVYKTSVPDGDNYDKAIWDACKDAGLIKDDSYFIQWGGRKEWVSRGSWYGAEITITEIE